MLPKLFQRFGHFKRPLAVAQLATQMENHRLHSTVDAKDVEHHSNLAANWWDPNGPVAPLHLLNDIR